MKAPFTPGFARYGSTHLWPNLATDDFEEAKRVALAECSKERVACIVTVKDATGCSVFYETFTPRPM